MEQQKLMKWSAVYIAFYAIALMYLLFYLSKNATIKVTEVSQDQLSMDAAVEELAEVTQEEKQLLVVQKGEESDCIKIPLDGNFSSTDITVQNNYLDEQIKVVLPGANRDFYSDIAINGDPEQVRDAVYHHSGEGVHLQFTMAEVYEITTEYEKNCLTILLDEPAQKFEKIVVLEPSNEENEMTWQIACDVRDALDQEGIKVYLTRTEQTDAQTERTLRLAESVSADMLIRVEPGMDTDEQVFGTKVKFNSVYFTPELNSALLADLLEREVTTVLEGNALGLYTDNEDDELLKNTTRPTAVVIPGFVTHEKEKQLLEQEQYRKKIADGICEAVKKAYDEMEINND